MPHHHTPTDHDSSADQDAKTETVAPTHFEGFHFRGVHYNPHNDLSHADTALRQTTAVQRTIIITLIVLFAALTAYDWVLGVTVLVALVTLLYFVDLLFNLFLVWRSLAKSPEITISPAQIQTAAEDGWPVYTILCPLYKEAAVLPQFIQAINALEYDRRKLQVLILLEENDAETIAAAESLNLPEHYEVVIVPHSLPKTKPKACNYGLRIARGEYVVIYDAEDVPDPDQLQKAYAAFRMLGERVACIQSKLNFYNPHQNLLTRAFTAEYSLWFDLVLTGLQSIHAPIPLGGTSNHFKTATLRALGGWDAFNVTEDADLGMRLVKRGYRTAIIDSTTFEEANSNLKNWYWQRTRWIKGYMQTYLVHTRRLRDFRGGSHPLQGLFFQLVIGGKVLSLFINPLMWTLTILYFTLRSSIGPTVEQFFPPAILYMAVTSLIFGNFLYMYYYMMGCAKRGYYELIKVAALIPLYWLAMSVAAWRSLYEVMRKPHHWSKTKHGLHLQPVPVAAEVPVVRSGEGPL